jgi:hypothetical protein
MSSVNIPITGDASSLVNATNKANAALNNLGASADKASAKVTPALGGMGGAAVRGGEGTPRPKVGAPAPASPSTAAVAHGSKRAKGSPSGERPRGVVDRPTSG